MYIISETENGKFFGEVLETGYYAEGDTIYEVQNDLEEHDVD